MEENNLRQTVVQFAQEGVKKRLIVQYGEPFGDGGQRIVNYEDLTDEQKECFDNFQQLSESLMNQ